MACFGEWRLTSGTLAGVMGVVGRIFRMAYGMDGTLCCFLNLRHLQYSGRCVSSLSDSVRMHAIPGTAKSCGALCQLGACPLLIFACFTQLRYALTICVCVCARGSPGHVIFGAFDIITFDTTTLRV